MPHLGPFPQEDVGKLRRYYLRTCHCTEITGTLVGMEFCYQKAFLCSDVQKQPRNR